MQDASHAPRRHVSRNVAFRMIALMASFAVCAGLARAADDSPRPGRPDVKPLTVGFVYVGAIDDFGYNQSHAEGADALKKLPGVTVLEAEKIAETKDCETVMETMIDQKGAGLIFATSYGYLNPHVKQVATKYPNAMFLHAGGVVRDSDPPNVAGYFAYIYEVDYLCGMVSGLTTKSNKLGFIAAKPITPVLRDINAFTLGARSVNPKATVTLIFTGDWFEPVREADAVIALADQGIDVVTSHVDSPKALIQTAEKRGMFSCGYHADGSALAPKGYLTGAQWNWGDLYVKIVEDVRAGKPLPRNYMGSVRDNAVKLSPFGPAVSDDTRKAVEPVLAAMKAGTFNMFKGPLKDNQGNVVLEKGKSIDDEDPSLWGMNYLMEGVIGTVGG